MSTPRRILGKLRPGADLIIKHFGFRGEASVIWVFHPPCFTLTRGGLKETRDVLVFVIEIFVTGFLKAPLPVKQSGWDIPVVTSSLLSLGEVIALCHAELHLRSSRPLKDNNIASHPTWSWTRSSSNRPGEIGLKSWKWRPKELELRTVELTQKKLPEWQLIHKFIYVHHLQEDIHLKDPKGKPIVFQPFSEPVVLGFVLQTASAGLAITHLYWKYIGKYTDSDGPRSSHAVVLLCWSITSSHDQFSPFYKFLGEKKHVARARQPMMIFPGSKKVKDQVILCDLFIWRSRFQPLISGHDFTHHPKKGHQKNHLRQVSPGLHWHLFRHQFAKVACHRFIGPQVRSFTEAFSAKVQHGIPGAWHVVWMCVEKLRSSNHSTCWSPSETRQLIDATLCS